MLDNVFQSTLGRAEPLDKTVFGVVSGTVKKKIPKSSECYQLRIFIKGPDLTDVSQWCYRDLEQHSAFSKALVNKTK